VTETPNATDELRTATLAAQRIEKWLELRKDGITIPDQWTPDDDMRTVLAAFHERGEPCDGQRCNSGGALHCHRCAEVESTQLLGERNRLREQLTAESLRADRAENARDQVGEMLHAAQERLGSIRNGVAHIQQLAAATERTHGEDDPVAITLRATARNFLAALGAGDGQDGAESNADGRTGPVASDAASEPASEAQKPAEGVALSVCGKYSKPGLGGILGPCIKAQGHPGTGDWHLDARGAAWDPNIDADASEQQTGGE
jgi:hypothetical protein